MDAASFQRASGSLEERLSAALARLALVGRSELGQAARAGGLSPLQALVLERLARVGSASVGELARLFGVTAPTMSDSVTSLQQKKLVERRPPARGRRVEVCVTARGRALADRQARWARVFSEAITRCTEAEKAVLLALCLRLIAALVEQGIIAEARLCLTCRYFQPYAHAGAERPHHCTLVDLPLSDAHLRVDCPDQQPVAREQVHRRLEVLQARAAGR